ncbi:MULTISPECIES: hypothetical protein [Sorangium]|uniref:Class I SAM-dependent methyltransferase n=1 Tax=Sorangium cellulosum TaxID=56 RepID=A0A4P2QP35_SORCE|nr:MULTISPECIES: hypothetical protein [Sorangium]AUX31907.1 uncharacterized protein SOCE836_040420 [Sorangium cellulosum]WCQ91281.1 hypothetical protein NQZ70_03997 [Sorangium sp. Soce836]
MVNVFTLVSEVLDEAYAEIPGAAVDKDRAVQSKLKELRAYYETVWKTGGPAFDDPVTRFAYVFAYVTCHANLVKERIRACPELVDLLTRPEIDITALGGGPGSDTIGVAKYLLAAEQSPAVQFYLCDRESLWAETWGDLGKKLKTGLNINTAYIPHDALDPKTWERSRKLLRADLFTMIYFVSEIYAFRDRAQPYFEHIFASAKPGAMFLFIDNNSDMFVDWFDGMASRAGMEVLDAGRGVQKMPRDEQMSVLQKYMDKFATAARLTANLAYRVLRKPKV